MTPEQIIALARELYAIDLPARRAAELAAELSRLHGTCRTAAARLAFDDACWSHAEQVNARLASSRPPDE